MSTKPDDNAEQSDKERLRELARSDRDAAPSYRALFIKRYGEEP
jgi:hypothetical protein